jgi:flavin-binding protein dodecin
MTKPREIPNGVKHAVEDALDEAQNALRELLPVLRGEKEMRFVLASVVDRLYRVVLHLKSVL